MGHICIFIIFPFSRLSTRSSAAGPDVFVLSFFWLLTVGLILKQLPETSSQLSFIPTGHSFISASPCRSIAFFLRLCRLSSSSSSSSAPAASLAAALCLPVRPSPAVSRLPPCHLQLSSCFRATYCGLHITVHPQERCGSFSLQFYPLLRIGHQFHTFYLVNHLQQIFI